MHLYRITHKYRRFPLISWEKDLSERQYKNVSVKSEFAEEIEKFVDSHPQLGYRSIAQFMEDASRRRLEELIPESVNPPRFEQINHDNNGVKVHDRQLRKVADIYFRPEGPWCDLDQKSTCVHIDYALSLPEIRDIVRKHNKAGWKLPDV